MKLRKTRYFNLTECGIDKFNKKYNIIESEQEGIDFLDDSKIVVAEKENPEFKNERYLVLLGCCDYCVAIAKCATKKQAFDIAASLNSVFYQGSIKHVLDLEYSC